MKLGGHVACLPRQSFGIVLACAAWLSLSPPLLAEDTAASDEEPGPVSLSRPADGAVVPGDKGEVSAGTVMVALSWRPLRPLSLWYFVEVFALGQDDPREVFTGYTRQPEFRLRLSPGRYVWRILVVNRASARYSISSWRSFIAGAAMEGASKGGR